MSDDKQPKTKRAAVAPQIVEKTAPASRPVAAVPPKPVAAALAKPIEADPPKPAEAAPPEPIAAALVEAAAPAPEPRAALPVRMPAPSRNDERWFTACCATLASMSESHAAIASDAAALGLEMTGLTRSYLTAAGDSAVAFFTARNLVDAVEAQLGFARRSIEVLAGGSTRLGELGVRLADDAAKPVFRSFAAG